MATRKEDMAHFTTLASIKVPRIMRAVFMMVLAAIVAAVAFLIYVPWVQTTSGRGVVTTLSPNERKQDINALVPGRIEEWFVRDGSSVKKGDPIVRIADIDPNLIERLQSERRQIGLQLQAAQSALATAEIDVRRSRELFEAGLSARRDYELARAIPPGRTITYGELAAKLGEPGAARAVGQALGHNPFAPVVPCHRVLAAGSRSGGFSATGGVATKLKMLATEGAQLGANPGLFDAAGG